MLDVSVGSFEMVSNKSFKYTYHKFKHVFENFVKWNCLNNYHCF